MEEHTGEWSVEDLEKKKKSELINIIMNIQEDYFALEDQITELLNKYDC